MRWIVLTLIFLNLAYFMLYVVEEISPATNVENVVPRILPLAVSRLVLLSEFDPEFDADIGSVSGLNPQPPLPGYCVNLGRFEDEEDITAFVEDHAQRFSIELIETEVVSILGYTVAIPPLPARQDAIEKLNEVNESLAVAALDMEIYLITRGEMVNGIALGLFDNHDNALNAQAALANLGYSANINEVSEVEIELSVAISGLDSDRIARFIWSGMLARRPYLQQTEKLCETIAHGQQFP